MNGCKAVENRNFTLAAGLEADIRAEMRVFKPQFNQSIALGVGLCIVSPAPVTLAGILDKDEAVLMFCCGLLLLTVAAGTFLFVRDGMIMDGIKRLLKRERN